MKDKGPHGAWSTIPKDEEMGIPNNCVGLFYFNFGVMEPISHVHNLFGVLIGSNNKIDILRLRVFGLSLF